VAIEDVDDFLADGQGFLEDRPLNAFRARRSSQRAIVTPEVVSV